MMKIEVTGKIKNYRKSLLTDYILLWLTDFPSELFFLDDFKSLSRLRQ